MVIDCDSSDTFLEWVTDYPVFGDVVCWRIDKMAEQEEAISFAFGIHLTAIVLVEGERMLATFTASTGSGQEGHEGAEAIRQQAADAMESQSHLKFRCGKFELF